MLVQFPNVKGSAEDQDLGITDDIFKYIENWAFEVVELIFQVTLVVTLTNAGSQEAVIWNIE